MSGILPPKPKRTALTDKPAAATIIVMGGQVAGCLFHPRAYVADFATRILDAQVRFWPEKKGRGGDKG